MYEDDIFSPDQEEIFKGDGAALQAINLTASTTGDLIFMCVKKSLHFKNRPWTWNTLLYMDYNNYSIKLSKEFLESKIRVESKMS